MTDIFETFARRAAAANPEAPEDYCQDGLLYCGACHTPKQCRPTALGGRIVPCQCACAERRYQAEKAAQKAVEDRLKIDSFRTSGIADKSLRDCHFEMARDTELLRRCRSYVENWGLAKQENMGLLLWGDTDAGKTFAAACIANAVIDLGERALITSFPRLLNAEWSEKTDFMRNVGRFPLVVLDDLGVERETGTALETTYMVVDERYKSGKPLIVTTNLHLKDMKNPKNMDYKRIFQRILEMCIPLCAEPLGFRSKSAERKMKTAREILGG